MQKTSSQYSVIDRRTQSCMKFIKCFNCFSNTGGCLQPSTSFQAHPPPHHLKTHAYFKK
ncbi:hypothetical protein LEMLEM_LOCUS21526 [Lemmus lemmus]